MKPAAIVLIAVGTVALAVGTWVSVIVPVRVVSESHLTPSGGTFVISYQLNVWGKTLGYKDHVTYASPEMKPHGEGVGAIADERIFAGAYDLSERKHGAWVRQSRFGTQWKEETEWYIHGEPVTREEWERGR